MVEREDVVVSGGTGELFNEMRGESEERSEERGERSWKLDVEEDEHFISCWRLF